MGENECNKAAGNEQEMRVNALLARQLSFKLSIFGSVAHNRVNAVSV